MAPPVRVALRLQIVRTNKGWCPLNRMPVCSLKIASRDYHDATQEDAARISMGDIRKVLERCIDNDKDVLLLPMSDADPVQSFFIVASTDVPKSAIIAKRIRAQLQNLNASDCVPVISSKSPSVAPSNSRDEQIREVTSQIESLIRAHLAARRN